ncbi:MAG: hypothetical protein ABI700_10815 [Chloroflexota bacterium]
MRLMSILPLLPLLLTLRVAGFVRDGGVEIAFPEVIRFSANLTIPATSLTSASLTITPEGHMPIPILVNAILSALVYSEPQGRIVYNWHIPPDDPLPLFTTVAYQWSFTAADGSTGTLNDAFTFTDPRVEWARMVDAKNQFSIAVPRALNPLLDPLRQVNLLLGKNTGLPLHENLILYDGLTPDCTPSADDPKRLVVVTKDNKEIDCTDGITDALFRNYQLLQRPANADSEDFLVGRLVRDAYAPLWKDKAVPDWFVDGLIQFYAPTPKSDLLAPAQQAVRGSNLFTLEAMRTVQQSTLWHAQSFGMVLYIADKITPQGLFDLAHMNAADFNAAYQAAMGAATAGLIPAWQQWIFTRAAESVYGITPYQPASETPTITPTASNTATPSPTSTLTPSITPTATATLYITIQAPTVTPSDTPLPPPPSVTPRPAGSLPDATPVPTALQTTAAQPGFQAGVGTFLVLMLALFLFLFFRLGKRR